MPDTLSNAITSIIRDAEIEDVSAQGLRKYFNVELQAARVPREWRYQMMGKKTGVYDENRTTKLFEAYREAYGNLRVYGVGVNVEVEELRKSVKELRQENHALRERLNHLETPLLADIERFTQIPGGKEFFSSIVDDAKEKLAKMLEKQKIE